MSKNLLSIKSIKVEQLFGYFDYEIPDDSSKEISKLLIIYGDNGSGKTTLLKVLFWLLSNVDGKGYKSMLASIRFKSITVQFENGCRVSAVRKPRNLTGTFTYTLKNKNFIRSVELKADSSNKISLDVGSKDHNSLLEILKYIRKLNISVFYLSEDRSLFSSFDDNEADNYRKRRSRLTPEFLIQNQYEHTFREDYDDDENFSLENAVEKLTEWIRNKTLLGSRTGEQNSQAIFTDLIKGLTETIDDEQSLKTKAQLIAEIQEIEEKIFPFVTLGLIDKFNGKTIKNSIRRLKTREQLRYLNTVISPYLESINAKLSALDKLQNILNLLISSVKDYFADKELRFDLNKGFSIYHDGGMRIDFDWLSSGEKQLLFLFIDTITIADDATILIIDEPEISLNIKWQRRLINTLLKFSSDKNVQFIFATHSLELLSSNLGCVSRLKNLSNLKNIVNKRQKDAHGRN